MHRTPALLLLALIAFVAFRSTTGAAAPTGPADAIYRGGDFVTMVDAAPTAEALAVKDGKILFVGSLAEAEALKGPATRVIDLGGKTMLPAFIDAHSHYINSLWVANQCKLYAPPLALGRTSRASSRSSGSSPRSATSRRARRSSGTATTTP